MVTNLPNGQPRLAPLGVTLDAIAFLMNLLFWLVSAVFPLALVGQGIYLVLTGDETLQFFVHLWAPFWVVVFVLLAFLARWFSKGFVARKRLRLLFAGFISLMVAAGLWHSIYSLTVENQAGPQTVLSRAVFGIVAFAAAVALFTGAVRRPT